MPVSTAAPPIPTRPTLPRLRSAAQTCCACELWAAAIVLAHRHETTRMLTFDERHFRTVAPLAGGAFTLLPADR
ncbi:MAG TPA: hypothetical protein VF250_00680 [Conexibacter sp.]